MSVLFGVYTVNSAINVLKKTFIQMTRHNTRHVFHIHAHHYIQCLVLLDNNNLSTVHIILVNIFNENSEIFFPNI